jgi:WD40 repeat protein
MQRLAHCLILGLLPAIAAAEEKKPPKITYDEHIVPILRTKCFSCHNADKKKGDLDMTNYTNLMLGGGSGEVVEPGDSSNSYLYSLVTHEDEPFMPPKSPKLADDTIETIRKWIDGGALENAGSKAPIANKSKFDFALKDAPTGKPAVPPMPARLSLEPVTRTTKTTAVSALATNPWSSLAAVAGQKQVLLYNTQTLKLLGALPFPEGVPQVLKFSRNGNLLLAGGGRSGASGRVIVWNIKTGERIIELGDELDTVLAADISADQTLIALGGPQRVVRIYSTETGKKIHELRKHTDWIYSIEFSPDGVLLATGDRTGGLYVWEGWTGREYLTLKAHSKGVTGISWRADSNVVASCSEDGSIRLWEMENGGQVKNWGAHGGGAASVEFCRDGRILSCGRDRVPKLWQQDGKQLTAFEAFAELAVNVTFCDETNRAIAGDWTGEVRIWNAADGARIGNLTTNPPKLAERLEAAKQNLAAKQAAHAPLAAAAQAAMTAATKAKADLAAVQTTATAAQKRVETTVAAKTAAKTAVDGIAAGHAAAVKAVTTLDGAVPGLIEAAAKAQASAAKLPDDQELAEVSAKLKAIADSRAAALATSKQTVTTKAADLEKAKAQYAADDKLANDAAAALAAAKAQAEKLTPLVKPAEEAAIAAKQAADKTATELAAAGQQVDRWNGEIAFLQKLDELFNRRTEAVTLLAARQAEHAKLVTAAQQVQAAAEKSKSELTAAQTASMETAKTKTAAEAAMTAAREIHAQAIASRDAAVKSAMTLESALAALTEAAQKTGEAAGKAAGDKELAAAAAQLTDLVKAKTTQLASFRSEADAKAKAVEPAAQQVAAAEKALADATAAAVTAQKRAAELAAIDATMQQKAVAAKQAADAGGSTVAAAEQQIRGINDEILVTRGIKQPEPVAAQAAS